MTTFNDLLPTCQNDYQTLNPALKLLIENAIAVLGDELFVDKDRLINKRKLSIEYQSIINELNTRCLMEHKTERNLFCKEEITRLPLLEGYVEEAPGRSYVVLFFLPDDPTHCIVTGARKPYDIMNRINRYIEKNRKAIALYKKTRSSKERLVSDVYLSVNLKKFIIDNQFKSLNAVVIGHYIPNGRTGLQPMLTSKMRQFINKMSNDEDYQAHVLSHVATTV